MKKDLLERINNLIKKLQDSEQSFGSLSFFLRNTANRIETMIMDCLNIDKEILSAGDMNLDQILSFKKDVVELERKFMRLIRISSFFPTFLIAYFGFGILFVILIKVDIINFIVNTLGVEAPEKLITLGVAGAFLFIATKYLENQEKLSGSSTKIGLFLVRISLAIIVPIILVILFFDNQGAVREFALTPEILSFSCGYSASLVIGIFNKIVGKGKKMIEAV